MKKKQKRIQIGLVLIGFFLIVATYFYYPYINKVKFKSDSLVEKNIEKESSDEKDTTFENVKYKGIYNLNKTFTVESEKAHILNTEPNIIYMSKMRVVMYLADGRIVNILSEEGTYNKITYDCFFKIDVKATDGETKIFADNLDLLATENYVKIYNDVIIKYPEGIINADKVDYDFEKKYLKVSMFSDEAVKMKVLK